jgi:hypothetical protein
MTLLEELCVSNEPVQHSVPAHTTAGGDLTDVGASSGPKISGGSSSPPRSLTDNTTSGGDLTDVPCWVARTVYGEKNPRWLMFRDWLVTEAPLWFRRLYIRHGQSFALFIAPHESVKSVIRRWMDWVIGGK